jgi:hypothetical protein
MPEQRRIGGAPGRRFRAPALCAVVSDSRSWSLQAGKAVSPTVGSEDASNVKGFPATKTARRRRSLQTSPKEEERRYRQNRAPLHLEAHSSQSALRAGRMDRRGRLEVDNDIVERYSNPRELGLPRAR